MNFIPFSGQIRKLRRSQTHHVGRLTYQRMEPRKLLAVVVADYVDDYSTPNPANNWQYLWNESGQFGTTAAYASMVHESWRYRPTTADFPYLGSTFGHPGPGLDDAASGGIERFAIAAYTVTQAGDYQITDSMVDRSGAFGDGLEISVHINDGPVTQLLSLAPASSGDFDTDLGNLFPGDTIYVGVGPDGPGAGSAVGNDGMAWDFSISLGQTAPVTVTVDLETQRFIGDVSELDREKYFAIHSGSSDPQVTAFRAEYDVDYGRQFWGPLPYAKNQTGQVGVYPNVNPSSNQSVRPTTNMVQTGHPRDALTYETDVQAAADWVTTYYTTVVNEVPEFYEPINEPFVHAGDAEFQSAPSTAAMRLKMAELYAAIGEAVDQTPALADMNVVGYSSAWPSVELWDFDHWDSRMKMFMDVAGDHMDAFSTHLYDGVNVTGQNNRRSGSNSEAILDLIETYSYAKWGFVKPHALTEYGGIEQGFGDTYSDLRSAQSVRSINHLLFNFLERQNDVLVSIPFITDKSEWFLESGSCEPYGAALWRPDNPDLSDCSGNYVYTWRVHFFDLWKDVQGERALINASDPDVQTQVFVDGSTAYVAVNNLADTTEVINLDFLSGLGGLQSVEIREMEIPVSGQPTYTETTQTTAPGSVTLDTGGTAVLVYEFDAPIEFSQTIEGDKYYTSTHLEAINANQPITFGFNNVETASQGEATLRMSIGRKHDRSKVPQVTVNNTPVDVPLDWKGYDQANRDDFFGMIEIPVPIALLSSNNTVSVTFPDSGGRVSSMILEVDAISSNGPEVIGVVLNNGSAQRSDVSKLDLAFEGVADFAPGAFSVTQISDATGLTGTAVDTSFTSQVVGGNTLVSLNFDSLTRNSSGALVDGNYQLTVAGALVTTAGTNMAMGSDFVFGDNVSDGFYSFFGDSDGDRDSDLEDYNTFHQSYRSVAGDATFNAQLDFEGNGNVNLFDYLEFRTRFESALPFTPPMIPVIQVAARSDGAATELGSDQAVENGSQLTSTQDTAAISVSATTDSVTVLADDQVVETLAVATPDLNEFSANPADAPLQLNHVTATLVAAGSTYTKQSRMVSSLESPLTDDHVVVTSAVSDEPSKTAQSPITPTENQFRVDFVDKKRRSPKRSASYFASKFRRRIGRDLVLGDAQQQTNAGDDNGQESNFFVDRRIRRGRHSNAADFDYNPDNDFDSNVDLPEV